MIDINKENWWVGLTKKEIALEIKKHQVKCLCGNSMYKSHDIWAEGYKESWQCCSEPKCRVAFHTNGGDDFKYEMRQGWGMAHGGKLHKIGYCLAVWKEVEA